MSKLILLMTVLAACATTEDTEQTTQAIKAECPDGVPAAIAPAADQDLALVTDAIGVQKVDGRSATPTNLVMPSRQMTIPASTMRDTPRSVSEAGVNQ